MPDRYFRKLRNRRLECAEIHLVQIVPGVHAEPCRMRAFGDDGAMAFLRTEFDDIVDKESINPGKQL